MKAKTCKLLSILLAILLVLPCLLTGSAAEPVTSPSGYALASWSYLAGSFEELVKASDVVLIGQVVSQRPDVRHDMVFTYSRVHISEVLVGTLSGGVTELDVLQTGGSANGITTPEIYDAPLMNRGENYLLCLTFSPADGTYPAYYLPTGGGQGAISFGEMASVELSTQTNMTVPADAELSALYARAESVFKSHDYGCCQPMSGKYGDSGDPKSGGHWVAKEATYCIVDNVSSTVEHWIDYAFDTWNDSVFQYSSSNTGTGGVSVYYSDMGSTDWEAITSFKIGEYGEFGTGSAYYGGEYYEVAVEINSSELGDYKDYKIRGIICHEAGHALGLAHVKPSDDFYSIMVPATANRASFLPTAKDIAVVDEIYDY